MRIIAGEARGRTIQAPGGLHTRPTLDRVRENMFNILQSEVPGSRVLDLFAGSGALSLEAISRGSVSSVMVDSDRNASSVQKRNAESLGYTDRITFFRCDWHKAVEDMKNEGRLFDLVFLDPPYAMQNLQDVFSGIVPLLHGESVVVLEHESGARISVSEQYSLVKQRSWGFCAVSIYRLTTKEEK